MNRHGKSQTGLTARAVTLFAGLAVTMWRADTACAEVINIDFNGARDGEAVAATYAGPSAANNGTLWNGVTVNSWTGSGNNDNMTIIAGSLLDDAGAATRLNVRLTNVGGDDNPSGAFPTGTDLWRDYVFGAGTFTVAGLKNGTTVDLYFYHMFDSYAFLPPPFTIAGESPDAFTAEGIYTGLNTTCFKDVPVTNGAVSGTFGFGIINGMSVQFTPPPPPPPHTVNIDFNGARGGEAVAATYAGSSAAGSGTVWNGVTVNSWTGGGDNDNMTIVDGSFVDDTGAATGLNVRLTNVGGDDNPSGFIPGTDLWRDYAIAQPAGTFTVGGLRNGTTVDLYFYHMFDNGAFLTPSVTITGENPYEFLGAGIFTGANTTCFKDVPVTNGSVSGSFGFGIINGISVAFGPPPDLAYPYTVNVDFNGARGGDAAVAATYVGASAASSGTVWNGVTVDSRTGTGDNDSMTISTGSLWDDTGAATGLTVQLTNVGGDDNPADARNVLWRDYVFVPSAGTFTVVGLKNGTTVDLYFYHMFDSGVSWTPSITIAGQSQHAFTAADMYTGANTVCFKGVPVTNGAISGSFGYGIINGMSVTVRFPQGSVILLQ